MNESEFIVYSTPAEDIRITAAVKNKTIWLTQEGMLESFAAGGAAITRHLLNIYEDGKLNRAATVSKMGTGTGNVQREMEFYDLDEKLKQNPEGH